MAGAGYKLFQTGDVLTAAQVNTYLNEQTVMVFANSTARTSALSGVLAEGMVSYLEDTNAVEVYNGSAWVSIGSSGDITGVTAGTGLSGGGTSGDVTLSLSTPVTATNGGTAQSTYATGDLLYASAANTLAKRAIGTTGQVLTVSGGVPTWASPAGGGKVLQVVQATYSTAVSFSSTTFTDTGLSATITPSATTSKILVFINQQVYILATSGGTATASIQLLRGSTVIHQPQSNKQGFGISNAPAGRYDLQLMYPVTYLDSPSTTSSITYKTQGASLLTTGGNQLNFQQDNTGVSVMTLLEIGA